MISRAQKSTEEIEKKGVAAKMTRTSTWEPRLEPESSASTNSAMAAKSQGKIVRPRIFFD